MTLSIGPAGLGPTKTACATLEAYHAKGFRACELAFTHGAYIKRESDARTIGVKARELGIALSIHAPYYVNLNSPEIAKREATKQRILECCKVGEWLGAHCVVFHPGYYTEDREASYQRVKQGVQDMMHTIKENKWTIALAPETMGKVNVFGSLEEIARLVRETGCGFCIDFAHLLARDKAVDYVKVIELFPQKSWHVHFSGIEYGEKGEKNHKPTERSEWKALLAHLPKDRTITLVNESPTMFDDCVEGIALAREKGLIGKGV